jgi:hypothetical protein
MSVAPSDSSDDFCRSSAVSWLYFVGCGLWIWAVACGLELWCYIV